MWDREWETNLLEAARERLKDRIAPIYSQIFELRAIRRWPADEVARTLGISLGRVKVAMHRLTKLVKREIEELRKKM